VKRVRPYPLAELPRLLRAQVEAGRALLAHLPLSPGPEWPGACHALGGDVELSLTEAFASPVRELERLARGARIRLSGPQGRWALVVVDPRLAPRLARRALGAEAPELAAPRPLTAAEEGALEFLVASLAGALPLHTDGALSDGALAELGARLSDEAWLFCLDARVHCPVGDGWARVVAPQTLRTQLGPPRRDAELARRVTWLEAARVSLPLELGRTALSSADLAALAIHDVVLFDKLGVRDARGGPVWLRLGRGGFRARLDGEALHIVEPFRLGRGAPSMAEETQKSEGSDALVGELPVEVVCELGRVTMSGRELIELRPGAVLPVGRPLAGPVDLTVGGRVVARGELVDVEGEIGVRITRLSE
jgi:type III secretion system YscQ/HrcQ family protein